MAKSAKPKQSSICSRERNGRRYFYCYIAGKQHGLGFDREEADRKYAELLAKRPMLQPAEPEQIPGRESAPEAPAVTVTHVLRQYLKWVKANRSDGTYSYYSRPIEGAAKERKTFVPFLEFVGDLPVSKFGEQVAKDWIETHFSHGSDTYKNTLMRPIKTAFKWAASIRSKDYGNGKPIITENPIEALELPSADSREINLTDDQWTEVESKAQQPFLDLLIVLKETGARPQELRVAEAPNFKRTTDGRAYTLRSP